MKPLLTIAIPTYNGGDNLLRAVKSCKYINLSSNQFEILVVDNCSTDGSIEQLKNLQQNFPNLRIIVNDKNYGRIGNWNRCIDLATGKYLIFLFSNDQINKNNDISNNIKVMLKKDIFLSVQPYEKKIGAYIYKSRFLFNKLEFFNFKDFLINNLNNFSFPFAPIQSNIYNLDVIKNYDIKFISEFDLNGDQLFSIEVGLRNIFFIYYPAYQITWEFTNERFHSKINIFKVISDDLKLLEYLIKKFQLKINYNSIICSALLRILKNNEWKNEEKIKSYAIILKKIFIYSAYGFFFFCMKKIFNKLMKGKLNV